MIVFIELTRKRRFMEIYRKKGRFLLLITAILLAVSGEIQASAQSIYYSRGKAEFLYGGDGNPTSIGDLQTVQKKSLGVAVVMSLIVPGTGELYSGRIWQGLVFLGIEAASWTAYVHYNNQGDEVDAAFRRFADAHWDAESYRAWIDEYKEAHNGELPGNFTHSLPETKTQQYYEMIGKYDQFVNWWDDYNPAIGARGQSARRLDYEEQRHRSNINYDRAHLASIVAFMNHIVSVIDTIYGVKKNEYRRGLTYYFNEKRISGISTAFLNIGYGW